MLLGWLNYDIETPKRKLGADVICGFTKGRVIRSLGPTSQSETGHLTAPPAPP
jgi:hypothetical protein